MDRRDFWRTLIGGAAAGFQAANMPAAVALPAETVYARRHYKVDIRKIITDNALRDMQREVDSEFIKVVDQIADP